MASPNLQKEKGKFFFFFNSHFWKKKGGNTLREREREKGRFLGRESMAGEGEACGLGGQREGDE